MSVAMERGYKAVITGTGIEFSGSGGGATATWILPLVVGTALGELNDGNPHFLVLDFELDTAPSTWRLRTSIDGLAFVDQLTAVGPIAASVVDTDPNITLAAAAADAFADEVVMYVGQTTFTGVQLDNMYDLANTFGAPLNQYQQNFGAPICWQATATIGGRPWHDSGSGPCPPVIRVPKGATDLVVTDDGMPVNPRILEG